LTVRRRNPVPVRWRMSALGRERRWPRRWAASRARPQPQVLDRSADAHQDNRHLQSTRVWRLAMTRWPSRFGAWDLSSRSLRTALWS